MSPFVLWPGAFFALTRVCAAQAVRCALGERRLRLLDLGCGTSALADALAQRGHEVTAVDYCRSAVAACRARQRSGPASQVTHLPPQAVYAVADATALPFRDASFDAVLDKGTLDVRAPLISSLPGPAALVWLTQ